MPNMFKSRIKGEEWLKMWLKEERHNQFGIKNFCKGMITISGILEAPRHSA
jgi:hypothetical protein